MGNDDNFGTITIKKSFLQQCSPIIFAYSSERVRYRSGSGDRAVTKSQEEIPSIYRVFASERNKRKDDDDDDGWTNDGAQQGEEAL